MKYEAHPYAELFPLMANGELQELVADIKANGLRDNIWRYEGKILDGRNRLAACDSAGVDPRFQDYTGSDPLGFVISKNLHRRHLDTGQRAMIAARMAKLKAGDNQHTSEVSGIPLTSQSDAAELLNVSVDSVKDAKSVQEKGAKELIAAVDAGEVPVSAAAEVAKLPKSEQKKVVAKGAKAVKAKAKEERGKRKSPKPDGTPTPNASTNPQPSDTPASTGTGEQDNPTETKVTLPPASDAWGIPIQDHAKEAFNAVPKFKELLRLLRQVRGGLTELCESPGGRLLLKKCQFVRSNNKTGGRWVLAELDNAIGVLEDTTPAHTDCPYHFNTYQPHGDDTQGRPCPVCDNKRFTGNLKRYQIPPDLSAAMRKHYGVTEVA